MSRRTPPNSPRRDSCSATLDLAPRDSSRVDSFSSESEPEYSSAAAAECIIQRGPSGRVQPTREARTNANRACSRPTERTNERTDRRRPTIGHRRRNRTRSKREPTERTLRAATPSKYKKVYFRAEKKLVDGAFHSPSASEKDERKSKSFAASVQRRSSRGKFARAAHLALSLSLSFLFPISSSLRAAACARPLACERARVAGAQLARFLGRGFRSRFRFRWSGESGCGRATSLTDSLLPLSQMRPPHASRAPHLHPEPPLKLEPSAARILRRPHYN